jgi:hypothetical protein
LSQSVPHRSASPTADIRASYACVGGETTLTIADSPAEALGIGLVFPMVCEESGPEAGLEHDRFGWDRRLPNRARFLQRRER